MIGHSSFDVDPWSLCAKGSDPDLLPHTESLFALANGHIGWRGILDEGEPHGLPGTYLGGVYELRPLPYAEAGFGYPESSQTVINVTNGQIIRLLVDDEPFDVRYGTLHSHERRLDFREGVLRRDAEWTSPAGRTIRVRSTRLVSLSQRSVAAICYEIEAVDGPARVVVQSELVANEQMPVRVKDPRAATTPQDPLVGEMHESLGARVTLVHTVRESRLHVGAAMDHVVEEPADVDVAAESTPDVGRFTITALLEPGRTLRIVKFVAYGWSAERSLPAVRDQVEAALSAARQTGWEGLLAEQRARLDQFWERADVAIEGDDRIQQAVRFALFHLFQASVRAERRAIPAKGLTGDGYDGHAFWDTESFVLQVLTYSEPGAVADALCWRASTIATAHERALQLGLKGAAFPWRTITGSECSGYWPAGTAAFHVNADIADAVLRYCRATGDEDFAAGTGLEILVATARLWCSLGHFDAAGCFRIEGVTGPDEYSALAPNNLYTNLMAQQNLVAAAEAVQKNRDRAKELEVAPEEVREWRRAAKVMYVPYDANLKVHPQAEGFTDEAVWPFEEMDEGDYPLLLNHPYFQLYRKQVVKQADLVLALHLRSDAFSPEEKKRNFDYYERLTVRDSSLSACTQAVIAAELGYRGLAYSYLCDTALMDIDDLEHNTVDGLHLAPLAGTWIALVAGFGGFRHDTRGITFAPRLPEGWKRLSFRLMLGKQVLRVEIEPDAATYRLDGDQPLTMTHYGEAVEVTAQEPLRLDIPAPKDPRPPKQPPGREPGKRARRASEKPVGPPETPRSEAEAGTSGA